jgi:hypothetical protein
MKNLLMTLVLTLSIVFSFSLTGMAQTKNVNVDNYRFNYVYRTSPLEPRNPLFFYFSSSVNATPAAKKNISVEEVNDALYVAGQMRTKDLASADLSLELTLGNVIIKSSEVKDRTESTKNKDGSTTTVHHYSVHVTYTFESSYVIKDKEKVLNKGAIYIPTSSETFFSDEYGTYKEAADFWNNNKEVHISNFYRNLSIKSANSVSSIASSRYGFPVVKGNEIIKTIDEKKHDENLTFRNASDELKKQLEAMNENTPMDREVIDGLIAYFSSIQDKYTNPANSKADKNLRYASYYNLCKIYIYLDEPENVAPWADLILSNGQDTKDCERMKKEAEEVAKILGRTEVKTRHFVPDDYFQTVEAAESAE